jgi:hypothetical protein
MFFAYYAANVAFMIPFHAFGNAENSKGKQVDMWAVGIMIYLLYIFYTHALFLTFIRNFNAGMLIVIFIVFTLWIPIFAIVNNIVYSDPLYSNVDDTIFDIHFWAVFLVTFSLMILPPIIYRGTTSLILFNAFNFG